jgi:hypothetical protein
MDNRINLQLFADEPAETPETDAPAAGSPSEKGGASDESGKRSAEPEKKYTDADVDRIVRKKIAQEREQARREKEEAEKLAEMNATQKAEYERDQVIQERDQARQELEEYKRKDALAEMTKVARKMLAEKGINVSDDLLALMVTPDAQATKTAIDGFAKLHMEAVEEAVKARLRGEPPRVGSGSSSPVSEIEKRIKKYQ